MKRFAACYLHGFLFAAAAPVIVYVTNPWARIYIFPGNIFRSVLFSIGLYLLLSALAFLVSRNPDSGGLIASLLVLGFMHLWPIFVMLALFVTLGAGVTFILRKDVGWGRLHGLLNALSAVLAGFYLVSFIGILASSPRISPESLVRPIVGIGAAARADGEVPDIYYIVLDGYGRADLLDSMYDYDNSPFTGALAQRGFIVAADSQSNYPRTVLSLSSSLNMQYLDGASSALGDSYLWWPVEETIHRSQVRRFLEGQGYRTVFIASGFDYTSIPDGDVYQKPFPVMLNDFEEVFFRATNLSLLQGVAGEWVSFATNESHRRIVLFGHSALSASASIPSPKFVFAHIVSPHPPFVFNEDGSSRLEAGEFPFFGDGNEFEGDRGDYRDGYIAQVAYLNTLILETVDSIIETSPAPPVIIIQADHGPGMFTDFGSIEATCLFERFSILNAYYLPGIASGDVPENISPVNSFRLIFDAYFDAGLGLLPEKRFFSTDYRMYQFEDVSRFSEIGCDLPALDSP